MAGRRWLLAVLCATVVSSWTFAVSAQRDSTEDARREYRRGMAAVRDARWSEAEEAFLRAYELAPRPLILFNLAGAQLEGGRLAHALETYRRFLSEELDSSSERFREEAERAIERLERITPRVTIDAPGTGAGDEVRLDGSALSPDEVGTPLPVDPGEHVADVARGDEVLATERFSIAESEAREIVLEVEPEPSSVAAPAAAFEPGSVTEPDEGGGSVLESPWLWIGAGVLIAGGVAAVVIATSGGEAEQPHVGNLPPGGVRL